MRIRWILGMAMIGAQLTACSGLFHRDVSDRTYILRAAPAPGPAAVPAVLFVMRPAVQPGLDTDRILLIRGGQELDHFAASRWGESLPRVVAALAVQSLAGGGGFANVVQEDRGGVAGDYQLALVVRHFEAAYTDENTVPTIEVAFDCTLLGGTPRRVLGRCDASASEPASANRMTAIVAAMELAAQHALAEVRTKAVAAASPVGK